MSPLKNGTARQLRLQKTGVGTPTSNMLQQEQTNAMLRIAPRARDQKMCQMQIAEYP